MAFIKKSGDRFCVHQAGNGRWPGYTKSLTPSLLTVASGQQQNSTRPWPVTNRPGKLSR